MKAKSSNLKAAAIEKLYYLKQMKLRNAKELNINATNIKEVINNSMKKGFEYLGLYY
jgi:hypothetical protein